MIFREAKIKDIPALSDLRLSVKENRLSDPGKITVEMYRDYLNEIGKTWLCEVDGEVIGFSAASFRDASIWALFVKPEYEGRGIGKKLLKLATDSLFERGAPSVSLNTEADTRADGFYQHLGWKRGGFNRSGEVYYTLDKTGEGSENKPPLPSGLGISLR